MKELYIEGVASHDDPESCVGVREGGSEALTGARAGRAIEPRNPRNFGVPTLLQKRKAMSSVALSRVAGGPRAVEEPEHVRKLHAREPGGPMRRPPVSITRRAAQGRPRPHA